MRSHTFLIIIGSLALILWVGLFSFMNVRYPNSLNQVIFLLIWWAAISLTMIPVAYLANSRAMGLWGRSRLLGRATRQGLLIGLLATALMALRFLRVLTPVTAILLAMVTVLVEVLALTRHR
jgi:hypothetical protein